MSQNFAAEYVAGSIAGSANVLSGYAFDTCKVRLQASPPNTYRNAWHCFRSILQYEGARGLYRGMSAPLIGGALETGVNYTVYTYMLHMLGADVRRPDLVAVGVSAGMAGVVLSPLLSPFELVKCRMQMASLSRTQPAYNSAWGCFQDLLRTEGLKGVTRGVGATMSREIPGNALFFVVYETLRRVVLGRPASAPPSGEGLRQIPGSAESFSTCCGTGIERSGPWVIVISSIFMRSLLGNLGGRCKFHHMRWRCPHNNCKALRRVVPGRPASAAPSGEGFLAILGNAASSIICGGAAGTIMWATVLPIDAAKTRLQTATPGSPRDVGIVQNICMMYREGGRKVLYAGIRPTLIRAFPANAAQWLAWEITLRAYHKGEISAAAG